MALHAKQQPYIQQPATPHMPDRQLVKKKKRVTKGEKILYASFLAFLVFSALLILHNQSTIHATAQDIQTIEQSVEETQKQNSDLSVQISELSTYERIWSKAKEMGLTMNEQNVKVVPGK